MFCPAVIWQCLLVDQVLQALLAAQSQAFMNQLCCGFFCIQNADAFHSGNRLHSLQWQPQPAQLPALHEPLPSQPVCCCHSGCWWNHPRLWQVKRPWPILCTTQSHAISTSMLLPFMPSVKLSKLVTGKALLNSLHLYKAMPFQLVCCRHQVAGKIIQDYDS